MFWCVYQAYYESEADADENEAVDVDVFLLVYSVTDRQSFSYVQQCLQDVAKVRRRRAGVVVVANKYDLVRNRVVSTAGSSVHIVRSIVKQEAQLSAEKVRI